MAPWTMCAPREWKAAAAAASSPMTPMATMGGTRTDRCCARRRTSDRRAPSVRADTIARPPPGLGRRSTRNTRACRSFSNPASSNVRSRSAPSNPAVRARSGRSRSSSSGGPSVLSKRRRRSPRRSENPGAYQANSARAASWLMTTLPRRGRRDPRGARLRAPRGSPGWQGGGAGPRVRRGPCSPARPGRAPAHRPGAAAVGQHPHPVLTFPAGAGGRRDAVTASPRERLQRTWAYAVLRASRPAERVAPEVGGGEDVHHGGRPGCRLLRLGEPILGLLPRLRRRLLCGGPVRRLRLRGLALARLGRGGSPRSARRGRRRAAPPPGRARRRGGGRPAAASRSPGLALLCARVARASGRHGEGDRARRGAGAGESGGAAAARSSW